LTGNIAPRYKAAMRVLTLVITFNDAAVIEQALGGLQRQTRPSDAIIIVDNASTDGTLDKDFSNSVIIHRNSENLGPSGAIRIAFAFALENGFDWTWVLDADSVPEPNALEKLLGFFDHLKTEQGGHTDAPGEATDSFYLDTLTEVGPLGFILFFVFVRMWR
jgi:glycosyltransferase involved in cell wall biosynthesis